MEKSNIKISRLFKQIEFTKLTTRALLVSLFIAVSFGSLYWRDEGVIGPGLISDFFSDIYTLFQFPTVAIFYHWGFYTWTDYIIALFINAYIWAIAIEIIMSVFSAVYAEKNPIMIKRDGIIVEMIGIIVIIISEKIHFAKAVNSSTTIAFQNMDGDYNSTGKLTLLYTGFIIFVIGWVLFAFANRKLRRKDFSIK
jgi:hypothetical protein